jgi:glycerol-1-phosphate dehydrogenase [NAD(P)+]
MTTIWHLPRIDFQGIHEIKETRPTALLTGKTTWEVVGSSIELPLVVQAEPPTAKREFMDNLAEGLPPQVEVIYSIGGGLVADVAKYVGWRRGLPVVIIPTALSVDGFFTCVRAVRLVIKPQDPPVVSLLIGMWSAPRRRICEERASPKS